MKRIILALALNLALALGLTSNAYADACGAALTGVFTAAQANKVCTTFGSAVAYNFVPGVTNTITLGTASKSFSTAYLGNVVMGVSGRTLYIQEATPTTACMGTATPNGTTPVAVTTSCAASGARVFYARAGAVTNMASISTTTAATGTGFSFASTGASDTLASSVIWFIINEAA